MADRDLTRRPRSGSDVCRTLLSLPDESRIALAVQAYCELLGDLAESDDEGLPPRSLASTQDRFMALDSVYRGAAGRETAALAGRDAATLTRAVMAAVAEDRIGRLAASLPASPPRAAILEIIETSNSDLDLSELADLCDQLVGA